MMQIKNEEIKKFFMYLMMNDLQDDFMNDILDILECRNTIKNKKEGLSTGIMTSLTYPQYKYTWKDLANGDGTRSYKTEDEWRAEECEMINEYEESVNNIMERLDDLWENYRYDRYYAEGEDRT